MSKAPAAARPQIIPFASGCTCPHRPEYAAIVSHSEGKEALTVYAPLVRVQHRSGGKGAVPAELQLDARWGVEATKLRTRFKTQDRTEELMRSWHVTPSHWQIDIRGA